MRPIVIGACAALLGAGLFGIRDLGRSLEHQLTRDLPSGPRLALQAIEPKLAQADDPYQLLASGRHLLEHNQPELALAVLKRAYELMPENRDLNLYLAWSVLTLNQEADVPLAVRALRTAQLLDPNYEFCQQLQAAYAARGWS